MGLTLWGLAQGLEDAKNLADPAAEKIEEITTEKEKWENTRALAWSAHTDAREAYEGAAWLEAQFWAGYAAHNIIGGDGVATTIQYLPTTAAIADQLALDLAGEK